MSEKKIVVKFMKHSTPYVAGDIAGINEADFEKLSKDGFVKIYKTKEPEAPKTPAK